MNRTVLGAFAALLLAAAGMFWWQGRAASSMGEAPPKLADLPAEAMLPDETGDGLRGTLPPEASEATREQRRFDRLDRNRDSKITRVEMLSPRIAGFRKLDADGNNLLSFEEWAAKTSNRFKGADRNGDSNLDRGEFVTTKPKLKAPPQCRCAPARKVAVVRSKAVPPKVADVAEIPEDEAED